MSIMLDEDQGDNISRIGPVHDADTEKITRLKYLRIMLFRPSICLDHHKTQSNEFSDSDDDDDDDE